MDHVGAKKFSRGNWLVNVIDCWVVAIKEDWSPEVWLLVGRWVSRPHNKLSRVTSGHQTVQSVERRFDPPLGPL